MAFRKQKNPEDMAVGRNISILSSLVVVVVVVISIIIAMTGFPICSSVIPLARQSPLAPAIFLPDVLFLLLSSIKNILVPASRQKMS